MPAGVIIDNKGCLKKKGLNKFHSSCWIFLVKSTFKIISYCHLKPHALNVLKSQFIIPLASRYSVLYKFIFKLIRLNSTLSICTYTAASYTRECSWPAQRGYSQLTHATTVGRTCKHPVKNMSRCDCMELHRPFVRCFVYNKPKVKSVPSSNHREHQ